MGIRYALVAEETSKRTLKTGTVGLRLAPEQTKTCRRQPR